MLRLGRHLYFILAFIIALLIAFKSLDYLNPDFTSGFLSDKSSIFSFYKFFLYTHMISATIAIIVGIYQFSYRKSVAHKYLGKVYAIAVVIFAGPSGFVMAFYALGGLWSTINFILLSGLWVYFTWKAWRYILKGNIQDHKKFIARSFILANSAILMRVFSFINNHYNIMDPLTGYMVIIWISWLPWLIFYEVYLRTKHFKLATFNKSQGLPQSTIPQK